MYEAGGRVAQKDSEKKSNGFEETAAFHSLDILLYFSSTLARRNSISLCYPQMSEDLPGKQWDSKPRNIVIKRNLTTNIGFDFV